MKFTYSLIHAKDTKPAKTFKAKDAPEGVILKNQDCIWYILRQGNMGFAPSSHEYKPLKPLTKYYDDYGEAPEGTVITLTQTEITQEEKKMPF